MGTDDGNLNHSKKHLVEGKGELHEMFRECGLIWRSTNTKQMAKRMEVKHGKEKSKFNQWEYASDQKDYSKHY